MLNIPEEVKNLFRADNINNSTEKRFKISFYNDEEEALYPYETLFPSEDLFPEERKEAWLIIENDRIDTETLKITESLSESEELQFGSCESAMMEIIVADIIENITEKEFVLTVDVGEYEMPLGIFTVSSFVRQADRRKRKIVAYDRMRKFDTDISQWYNELNFPMTLKTFRDSLCDYIGIQQEETDLIFDSMEITKTIEPQEMSGLDVIKSICEINGCFGHINKFGKFYYIKLPLTGLYPSEDLFPDENLFPAEMEAYGQSVENVSTYKDLSYEDYMVEAITSLSIREQEGDIGANVGDGQNVYVVEGNFLVYGKSPAQLLEIAETLLPVISNRIYKPASLSCNAMPWVEVGDAIRVITRDDVIDTFVMNRVTSGCQAITDEITSTGSPKREEVFGINKQIIQLEGKSAVIIKNVEEVSVRITDLKEQEEAHFKITSSAIEAEVKRATGEEAAIRLEANQIELRVTKQITDETERAEKEEAAIRLEANQIELRVTKQITDETERATKKEAEISVKADQINLRVSDEIDRATKAEAALTVEANQISLRVDSKVTKGDVTEQLNSELKITGKAIELTTGHFIINSENLTINEKGDATFSGQINGGSINIRNVFTVDILGNTEIRGDHFSWNSTYSSLEGNGKLTCEQINVKSGTFSGNIIGGSINIAGAFSVSNNGDTVISGNKLSWNSTNSSMTSDGTLTCKNIKSEKGTFSGTIEGSKISGTDISGGTINISGKKTGVDYEYNYSFVVDQTGISWESLNSSLNTDGMLTAKNANFSGSISSSEVTSTTIRGGEIYGTTIFAGEFNGGEISVGPFAALDDSVYLGDYYVSSDGTNMIESTDKSILIQTSQGGPLGSYPSIQLKEENKSSIITGHHISSPIIFTETSEWRQSPYSNNIGYILDAIWTGHPWSLETLAERISDLEARI